MKAILEKYLPVAAVPNVMGLIRTYQIHFKIVNHRVTRHGDYRKLPNGEHQITVNASLNKFRFLITTVHEIAHLVAIETYGRRIKPHGQEWKHTFQKLMIPFINPQNFPEEVLPLVINHFKNPKASSDTDALLSMALKKYDAPTDEVYIDEIPLGTVFKTSNGKLFKKGRLIIKRFECVHLKSGRIYLFQPNTQVKLLNKTDDE